MAKNKLSTRSLATVNLNDINYMCLHKRMYTACSTNGYIICLHGSSSTVVSIPVADTAAKDFLAYEMSFDAMLNVFSALCIKLGEVPF